jgi:hypothetical protein
MEQGDAKRIYGVRRGEEDRWSKERRTGRDGVRREEEQNQ